MKKDKFNDKRFRGWLKEQMLLVTPPKFFNMKLNPQSNMILYEMICNRAGLRPESTDVQQAYKELTKKRQEA